MIEVDTGPPNKRSTRDHVTVLSRSSLARFVALRLHDLQPARPAPQFYVSKSTLRISRGQNVRSPHSKAMRFARFETNRMVTGRPSTTFT